MCSAPDASENGTIARVRNSMSFEVDLDHRDFVEAMSHRPEHPVVEARQCVTGTNDTKFRVGDIVTIRVAVMVLNRTNVMQR
jgi:hypothetical protein